MKKFKYVERRQMRKIWPGLASTCLACTCLPFFTNKKCSLSTHASWTPGLSSAFCLRLFFEVSDSRINWNFLNVITDNLVRLDIISLPKWVYFLLDLQYQATVGSNTLCEQPLQLAHNTHPQIYRQSLFSSDRSSSVYPGLIMSEARTHFFRFFRFFTKS